MPVNFLSNEQQARYGVYPTELTDAELSKYFHLDDKDQELIAACRRDYNKLGYALQLATVRFLGMFLTNPIDVPEKAKLYLIKQLGIAKIPKMEAYLDRKATRLSHTKEIRKLFGYNDFELCRFRITRWLYSQAWFGNERPSILFERCIIWLIDRKVLLPGISTLTTLISRVRERVTNRLWNRLAALANQNQIAQLEALLLVTPGSRYSKLDYLKNSPTNISSSSLTQALLRYQTILEIGAGKLDFGNIPKAKINHLARYVTVSWAPSIARMPYDRKIAVLLAFAYVYEIKALDDALNLLDVLITEMLAKATRLGREKRLRTMGDLDKAALNLADFVEQFIKYETNKNLTQLVYGFIPKQLVLKSVEKVRSIAKPNHDKYYAEMLEQYRTVRRFLPMLLNTVNFKASKAGETTLKALKFLTFVEGKRSASFNDAPLEIINSGWRDLVINPESKRIEREGYTLCAMDNLQANLHSRDVFVDNSQRWCDPRAKLIAGLTWEKNKIAVCNSLNLEINFDKAFNKLSIMLHDTYECVIANLSSNDAIEFIEGAKGKARLKLAKLDKVEKPARLEALKEKVAKLLPAIDLPELLLEVNRLTGFTEEFTHISDSEARVTGIETSLCAVLMTEACNIGLEPVIKNGTPQLTRNRLSWVQQNCIRAETLAKANARIVDYHSKLPLAKKFGSGDVATADGLRFACAIRTSHSGPNRKYYGSKRGVTYYNFTSDQNTGFYGIVIPGTLRDSLYLLDGILEQQTSLDPREIISDTAGASAIVFALFWLLGYQFSPRLADIGKIRFWRVNSQADYKEFNGIAKNKINESSVEKFWEDILRTAVSLKLGYVSASDLIHSLFHKSRPSGLAKALINLGRIIKTLFLLNYIDDEEYRRHILKHLNKGESRHSLARSVYYGRRGQLYEKYHEGQEDQLNALGLVTNAIVVWNTVYMQPALDYLRSQGEIIDSEDEASLSPLLQGHINFLGKFSFQLAALVEEGHLRPLNRPEEFEIT